VFGLPGNPVSALAAYEVFVRPALLAMPSAQAQLTGNQIAGTGM
jgi:molybdopterin biosynthesis enzyme